MSSFHELNLKTLKRMTQICKVEQTHTAENGKGDYLINPYYYFDRELADDNQFKTADLSINGKTIRVIYALNKDGVPFGNSWKELRALADDKFVSGRICLECLNPITPIKNDFMGRLCCKPCDKGKYRKTK
jgi:hypothetical protein